jgi:hypothetical protein
MSSIAKCHKSPLSADQKGQKSQSFIAASLLTQNSPHDILNDLLGLIHGAKRENLLAGSSHWGSHEE